MYSSSNSGSDAVCMIAKQPLTTGRPHLRVTHFPSLKNSMMIPCGSLLTAGFCVHFEYEKNIVSYATRPCSVRFLKRNLTVHPDFCAVWADGTKVFYQICSDVATLAQYNLSQIAYTKDAFANAGLVFEHIDVATVQATIRTDTLRTLYFHSHGGMSSESPGINETLKRHFGGRARFRDLIELGIPKNHIAHGVFHQALRANLLYPANLEMIVEAYH